MFRVNADPTSVPRVCFGAPGAAEVLAVPEGPVLGLQNPWPPSARGIGRSVWRREAGFALRQCLALVSLSLGVGMEEPQLWVQSGAGDHPDKQDFCLLVDLLVRLSHLPDVTPMGLEPSLACNAGGLPSGERAGKGVGVGGLGDRE